AAAALDARLAAILLDAARADGDSVARDEARRLVTAAGMPPAGDAALVVGVQALAAALADEGGAAIQAVAQCLPPETGRRLLAAAIARRDALSARAPAGAALEIVLDETVGRHGCVIETALGRVDARLETQLAALERALLEETHG